MTNLLMLCQQRRALLRTLDAVHLATAMAVGDELEAIVTYDERMIEAARLVGLQTASPR